MATDSTDANLKPLAAMGQPGDLSLTELRTEASASYSLSPGDVDATSLDSTESFSDASTEPSVYVGLTSRNLGPIPVADIRRYLAQFAKHFRRSEGRESLERHLIGLLSDIERKNEEQIAHALADTNSQRLQALLTELRWDAEAVNEMRVQQLIHEATGRGGTLVCGETEMQKQGQSSVGVARQYVDALGKVKNCQLVVSWQYVDSAFSWPVNARLFLPQEWVTDAQRGQRARVPERERVFFSKAEIALRLLDEATMWGVPYRQVVTSASYGSDPLFLEGLDRRKIEYLVAAPEEFAVQVARRRDPSGEPAYDIIERLSGDAWQPMPWSRSRGLGKRSVWARAMGWRATPAGPGAFGWLVAERSLSDEREPVRYYFTNTNVQTSLNTLVRMARRTQNLDEFYRFAKTDLGWNQYEGRLWHGFHRHTLLVFLAASFLTQYHEGRI
jgi:SRSO17 transposase